MRIASLAAALCLCASVSFSAGGPRPPDPVAAIDESAILAMAPSATRDTMLLRQRLLLRDTAGAAALVSSFEKTRRLPSNDRLLWKARVQLFSGNFDELTALLDSARIETARPGAQKLLSLRLALRYYEKNLPLWAAVEYDCFSGRPDRAADRIYGSGTPASVGNRLLRRVVRELERLGDRDSLHALFAEHGASMNDPELIYRQAVLMADEGDGASAVDLLMRVIGEFPHDPFAQKARILLARLRR